MRIINGADSFVYQICDSNGDCDPATVSITVNPVNDNPIATDDVVNVAEDAFVNITVLSNDDFGGDGPSTGTITAIASPTNGTLTLDDNGTPNDPTDDSFDYTPDPDYTGADSFTYSICDADGDCDQATVNITVDSVNDNPIAADDGVSLDEDTNITVDVLANDNFGGDGPSTGTITLVTPATNGSVTLIDGGTPLDPTDDTFDYTPNADYNGADSFTYEICDSNGDCDPATVSITVNSVDDAPIAVDDLASTDEDASVNITVLDNDDFGGDGPSTGTITLVSGTTNGTISLNNNGSLSDPTDDSFDYTPNADYNGPDSFTYEICDADGDCDPATVNITVNPINDNPMAVDDLVSTNEDVDLFIPVTANDDFGGDGPSIGTITLITTTVNGSVTLNDGGTPLDPTDDAFDYSPNANYNGTDSLVYEICDSNGDCDQATVLITVNSVDDDPVANNDLVSVDEDDTVNITLLSNDDFGGDGPSTGTITIVSGSSNGTATINDGGTPNDPTDDTVDYTPNADYNGPDSFTYYICDANGDCDQATVNITVDPVNDLPTAVDDVASVE